MNTKIKNILTTVLLSATAINLMPLMANAQNSPSNNPVPVISSISPGVKTAGEASFTLTVNGSHFIPSSSVRFDGALRTTTYVSDNRVTAVILASDIDVAGEFNVTVVNPAPQGGTSNEVTFEVTPSTTDPVISSISPNQVSVGGAGFTLVVNGFNFVAANTPSVLRLNGSDRTTTVVSSNQLTAFIPSSDISSSGIRNITVYNAGPNNMGTSNTVILTVNPVGFPVVNSISPSMKVVGSSGFILTVNGFNFSSNSIVKFNGLTRVTNYVSPTMVTALILASDLSTPGVQSVSVTNPDQGTSNTLLFTVSAVPGLPNTGIGPNPQDPEPPSNTKALTGLTALFGLSILLVSLAKARKKYNA